MRRLGLRYLVPIPLAAAVLPIPVAWRTGLSTELLIVMGYVYFTFCATAGCLALVYSRRQQQQTAHIKSFFRYQSQELNILFRNIEACAALNRLITPTLPLPHTRGDWAVSPDLLKIVAEQIVCLRPRTVVELGSGVSSVYIGYLLKANGAGRLHALDHAADYAARTRESIGKHALTEYVDVAHAPLQDVVIDGRVWPWYGMDHLPSAEVDLLVVDGPPASVDERARYPAVPLLLDRLSDGAVIVVDDYARAGEREVVRRWLSENACLTLVSEPETEQGTAILRKVRGDRRA